MENTKIYKIVIEGIDKTGKDSLVNYVNYFTNYKYVCTVRGIVSVMCYNELFGRTDNHYDLTRESNTLNVLLTVDKEDWKIRCRATNEPSIDFEKNQELFDKYFSILGSIPGCNTVSYNTTYMTPYEIGKSIAEHIKMLNGEE